MFAYENYNEWSIYKSEIRNTLTVEYEDILSRIEWTKFMPSPFCSQFYLVIQRENTENKWQLVERAKRTNVRAQKRDSCLQAVNKTFIGALRAYRTKNEIISWEATSTEAEAKEWNKNENIKLRNLFTFWCMKISCSSIFWCSMIFGTEKTTTIGTTTYTIYTIEQQCDFKHFWIEIKFSYFLLRLNILLFRDVHSNRNNYGRFLSFIYWNIIYTHTYIRIE